MTEPTTAAGPPDKERGIYGKYRVERVGGTPGKHDECFYYVLDLDHDLFAFPALAAYASACEAKYPQLAIDLRDLLPISKGAAEAHQQDGSALREARALLAWVTDNTTPDMKPEDMAASEWDALVGQEAEWWARIHAFLAALPPSAPPALDVEQSAKVAEDERDKAITLLRQMVGQMEAADGRGDEEQHWANHPEWPDSEMMLMGVTVGHLRTVRDFLARLQEQERPSEEPASL